MFHQQTEDTDGERKRLEGWWFKLQKPFSPQSVILLTHTHTHAHTASCLLCFFLLPSLYSPFNADLITNMSSVRLPPFAPSHQVSFESESSAPALRNGIVCRPAWGCLRGLGLERLFPISLNGLKGTLLAWQLQEKEEKSHGKVNLKSIT